MSGIIGGSRSGIVGQSDFFWVQYHENIVHIDATYGGTGNTTDTFTLAANRAPIGCLVFMDISISNGSATSGAWHFRVTQDVTGVKVSGVKGSSNGYSDGTYQMICPIETAADRAFTWHSYVTTAGLSGHNYRTLKYLGYLYGKK